MLCQQKFWFGLKIMTGTTVFISKAVWQQQKPQITYEHSCCESQILTSCLELAIKLTNIPIWIPNWCVGFIEFQFGFQIGVLVFQNFNLESKSGCWFSSISIWNPNWCVGLIAFKFGIQIGVLLFQHFNLESKSVSKGHFGIHNRNKQLIYNSLHNIPATQDRKLLLLFENGWVILTWILRPCAPNMLHM